jgi:hypothetical protein
MRIASLQGLAKLCEEEGLPKQELVKGVIAAVTSGNIGVVAL